MAITSTNHFCDISVEKEVDKKINVAKNKKHWVKMMALNTERWTLLMAKRPNFSCFFVTNRQIY